MPATRVVTGQYVLRPTSKIGYISSGTFSNYFTGDAPSSWTSALSVTDTALGDNSDSTYAQITPNVGARQTGRNMCFWVSPDSNTPVPEWDYRITSVSNIFRWAGSHEYGTGLGRSGRIFSTLYDPSNASQAPKDSSFYWQWWKDGDWNDSIENVGSSNSYASGSSPSYYAGTYPKAVACCMSARKITSLHSFNWLRCYEISYTVSFSYVETAETMQFFKDEGCIVTSGGSDISTGSYENWRYTNVSYTASVKPGYSFDGWYLNGYKVSSSTSYTYEHHAGDVLYCLSKVRKIFDGTVQLSDAYIGTSLVKEIYIGTTKIWGDSDLLPYALGG